MLNITRDEAIKLFTALGSKTADKWGRKQMTEKIHKVDEMVDTETEIPPEIEPVLNSVLTAIEDGEEIVVTKERIESGPVGPVSEEPEETYSVYVHPESDSVFVAPDDSVDDGLTQAMASGLSKEEAEEKKKSIEKEYLEKSTHAAKEKRSKKDRDIPKCSCGNNLSIERQEKVINHCPACDDGYETDMPENEDQEEPDPPSGVKVPKPDGVRILKSRSYYAGMVIRSHGISSGITEAMVNELDKMYKKRNRQESMYRLRLAWHAIYGFCGLEPK